MQSEIVNAESQDLWEAFMNASIFAQVAAGSFVLGKFWCHRNYVCLVRRDGTSYNCDLRSVNCHVYCVWFN